MNTIRDGSGSGRSHAASPMTPKTLMPRTRWSQGLAIIVALLARPAEAAGESVVLRPLADTSLFESAPHNNGGALLSLAAGETGSHGATRSLIRFDVAGALPAGAQVISARMRLEVVRTPEGGGVPSRFDLHRILHSWTEGRGGESFETGLGRPGLVGEVTWASRARFEEDWPTPGLAAGTNFVAPPSSRQDVDGLGAYTFASSPAMIADVQLWLDAPWDNHDWLLKSAQEGVPLTARRFGAREDAARAARLEVEYAPPLPDTRLRDVTQNGRLFRFRFDALAGYTYTVERRHAAGAGEWSPLTNFTAKLVDMEVEASDVIESDPARFYRVRREPCQCD